MSYLERRQKSQRILRRSLYNDVLEKKEISYEKSSINQEESFENCNTIIRQMEKRMKINKKLLVIQIVLFFIFMFLGVFLYINVPDNDGRDLTLNLHDGYILESMNGQEQVIIYWDFNKQMKTGDGEEIILEGALSQYKSTNEYLVVFDWVKNQYNCIDKKSKNIVMTASNRKKMKSYIQREYGDESLELDEIWR